MNKNETTIRARGYEVTLPTAAVAGFLALSHDDQCDMADQFNLWDANRDQYDFADIDETEDFGTADVIGDLIEEMAQDLDNQDHAIDLFMADRAALVEKIDMQRIEIEAMVDAANGLYRHAANLDQAVDAFMADRRDIIARGDSYIAALDKSLYEREIEVDNLTDTLVQSARYVGQAREMLGKLGITIQTDNTNGQPVLVIDGERFTAAAMVVADQLA